MRRGYTRRMSLTRRDFLMRSAAVSVGFAGLSTALANRACSRAGPLFIEDGFGPLVPDPDGIFDLPAGFSYKVISRAGDEMDDGLIVPGQPDGMAAFPGSDGLTIVVRNHEMERGFNKPGPFGHEHERLALVNPEFIYDAGGEGGPSRGGTTTIVYDTKSRRLVRQFLSLAGTERNCAGGMTPRGTWLTCEETVVRRTDGFGQDHGWVFEVPATLHPSLTKPVPLRAMGRFYHEACATDPRTGIVYMTEDRPDGLLYRFIPHRPDDLSQGGRLQALKVTGSPRLDTRNWEVRTLSPRSVLPCEWIDIEGVEAPDDDLRYRGHEGGAARFARGEGMWFGHDAVYFACTNGGDARCGQIFRLTPGATASEGDTLELFVESPGPGVIEKADNITFAPWGDMIVCEDGKDDQFLLGITPTGGVYRLGRNAAGASELAGACFSPDGSTLFVNILGDGMTLAIHGPWGS